MDEVNEICCDSIAYTGDCCTDGDCSGPNTCQGHICGYCGDGTCNALEDCNNCPNDCLGIGEVCCDAVAYPGNCCDHNDCSGFDICTDHTCVPPSCGDEICQEDCNSCPADCLEDEQVCCDTNAYTGDCCDDNDCTAPYTCTNNICTDANGRVEKDFWAESLRDNLVENHLQGLGLCHSTQINILEDPSVSWSYDAGSSVEWPTVEPNDGQFNWTPMDDLLAISKAFGTKAWLQIQNHDATPEWAKTKSVSGVTMEFLGGSSPSYCDENDRLPVPWNTAYLALWRRAIHKMAERYDNNDTIEAIVTMASGGYGEMAVCSSCGHDDCWDDAAGCSHGDWQCTSDKFIQGVKDLIDLYLEEEHTWGSEGVLPPSTVTHGFLKKPVILQLGSGPYDATNYVIQGVLEYAIPKYGMRVLFKSTDIVNNMGTYFQASVRNLCFICIN